MQNTKKQEEVSHQINSTVRSRKTVLVVEPNPDQQWKLARMLTIKGYRVIGTSSCDGAVALLKEYPVGIALLAEKLPKMSGSKLASKLLDAYPDLRVVIVCDDRPKDRVKACNSKGPKVFEFPAKPFRMDTLSEILANIDFSVA